MVGELGVSYSKTHSGILVLSASSRKPCPKMASSTTQKPSSSSSSSPPTGNFNFDFFLSFRGEDTRYNFTDHLFVNLDRMGINTFRDDKLERGEEIGPELLGTIEGSRVSIIVFSEKYADSKWCLDELTKIMECRAKMDQIVLPVFYHVDPSDVRKQTGSFGEAFARHETIVDEEKVQRWRAAMTEASSLSGWHVKDDESESEYIKEIIDFIYKRLDPKLLHVGNDIVGMDLRLKELKSLINSHLRDVRVVGIYGIGGIGKTTIAKLLYNKIRCEFNGASFLENVRERSQLQLQKELLHGIFGEKKKLSNINDGINMIKNRLCSRKVLIVIDDVNHSNQLMTLCESKEWFGEGSRIVITTRNQDLLRYCGVDKSGVDERYEVKVLHDKEAIQLFNMYAFKQNAPKDDYVDLSKGMVDYAQGLPLALKVLGASLHGRTIDEWKSELDKLKKIPMKDINDVLRRSFDVLDPCAKKVFLDIACFFKGEDEAFVSTILNRRNLNATDNIKGLCKKCLITVSNNKIQMHDLIQQMGWAIVREECPEDPSKWSRLWDLDDIGEAFSKEKGMENIETISLDLSRSKEIQLSSKALANMKKVSSTMEKLRLLKVYYSDHHSPMRMEYKVLLPKDFEFPPNLIYLHWEGYTSKSLPLNFCPKKLVALNLKFSNIKELWKSDKDLANLKFMDLSYSQQLIKIPEFSRMPKLERLNLEGCTSFQNLGVYHDIKFSWKLYLTKFLRKLNFSESGIKELPSSIGSLTSLEILNLSECSKFKKFPDIFANMGRLRELRLDWSGIEELPSSIGSVTSLENLNLRVCKKFKKFPDIFTNMGRLRKLHLHCSGIEELPSSTGSLTSLEILDLSWCKKFEKFPDIFASMGHLKALYLYGSGIKELPSSIGYLKSLKTLSLSFCSNFEKFPGTLGNMRCLRNLDLIESAIKELPNNIGCLEALQILSLSNCSKLEKLPEFQSNMGSLWHLSMDGTAIKELPCSMGHFPQLRHLNLENCKNLTSIPSNIFELKSLKDWSLNGCSNLEIFPKITEDMEHLQNLYLCKLAITDLPSSIERLKYLRSLELSNCKDLETLPNSIGYLTCLRTLSVCDCPKLHKLPESLRSLQCCLEELEVAGCNMMEGAIPSDLWCLFSLVYLNVSGNNIRCIPAGIIQLSQLNTLRMNHCPKLEEIPELPSSLRRIEAHGCPCLETLSSDETHLLWSSLLNCFKSQTQDFIKRIIFSHRSIDPNEYSGVNVVIPGRSGMPMPNWIRHRSMGREIQIELPKNWYDNNNLLGFALFFHHVPLDDDDEDDDDDADLPGLKLWISHGDQFECMGSISFNRHCKTYWMNGIEYRRFKYHKGRTSSLDPALRVVYFPKITISSEYHSSRWNKFKARFEGPFECGPKVAFKVESCGINFIYNGTQDHHQQSLQLFNVKRRCDNTKDHPHHKKSRHV